MKLSEKLEKLNKDIAKLQYELIQKGWSSVDLERPMILLEGNVNDIRRYEALEEEPIIHLEKGIKSDWGIDE